MPMVRAASIRHRRIRHGKLDCDRRRAVCREWIVVVSGYKGKMLISVYDNDAEVIWNFYQWLMQL
jgi:hypothetical protein